MEQKGLSKLSLINDINSEYLLQVLGAWEKGSVSTDDVVGFAEEICISEDVNWSTHDRDTPRSVLDGVILLLSMTYTNPILKVDIPALRCFLKIGG